MTTDPSDYASAIASLRATFAQGITRPLAWRRAQLKALKRLLAENRKEIERALYADLAKPSVEGWLADIALIDAEIDLLASHLGRWSAPRRVSLPLAQRPGSGWVVPEPYGVALVIAPWNYPLNLALVPLAAAIAAGNCAIVKPSEMTPATSSFIARRLPAYLDTRAFAVVEGGAGETGALLAERFDVIFFTGSARVGKVVMHAAAEHLTPVVLELGGKSPVLVDEDSATKVTARRIAIGKFLNAGQTCIAPDYVLVHERVAARFSDELARALEAFYGERPEANPDFARIVNDHHFTRLCKMLDASNGTVRSGGSRDRTTRYIAPTVVTTVGPDDALMHEEIFGPILPVLTVRDMDEALAFVAERPTPLALYLFSGSRRLGARVKRSARAGGVGINTTVLHFAIPNLPFGGLGQSGMGGYHGRAGFDAFTHYKSVLEKPRRIDLPVLYPPYRRWKRAILERVL